MALTVIFALVGSLILSLTLMPALCATFLPRRMAERENRFVAALQRRYRQGLAWAMARPWLVLLVAGLLLAGSAVLATRLGSEFVPRLREGSVVINTVRLAGVSIDESTRYGTQIERTLLAAFPDEIERVWTRTGTAEIATDPMGTENSDVFITLRDRKHWKKAHSQDDLVRAMEERLSALPGMRMIFTQPIEMRVNEMIAGVRSDVGVKLFGDDFATLKRKSREIELLMRNTRGSADVFAEQVTGQPVLEIEVDRDAIARHGITAREVLEVVEALGTREVGEMQEGERRFPISVRLDDAYRTDVAAVGRILVTSASGARVPLDRVARIRVVEGPSTIHREWAKRRVVIQANVRGRDVGSYVADLRRTIDRDIDLPPGYYVRFGGQFEHLARAQQRLLVVVPLALALILGLLYLTFRSLPDAARVFVAVPLAVIGGVVALWLRGLPFSISAAVGFIALSGVSVLNALVLVSTMRQMLASGASVGEAIPAAAERRLRPVLLTALVASLGFVPMALNTGIGAEVQRPLATVVIGGVVSSTVLTLFVLPVLYLLTERRRRTPTPGDAPAISA
jgi:cobalt-zinc-cadmium resistance protein CzcA